MEFLVLTSQYRKHPERDRKVMQAVVEAAETVGAERVVRRKGNVYSTGVYLKDGEEKKLVYIDWEKDWSWRRIYQDLMASIQFSPNLNQDQQIYLEA
jgi:hypothetical protein